jgi:hypothetical protein
VKLHEEILPPETEHVMVPPPAQSTSWGEAEVTDKITKVSEAIQPIPVTWTTVPVGPELGVSVNIGLVTVNVTEIDPCSTYVAEMVIVCAPKAAVASTSYVPVRTPLAEMLHTNVVESKVGDGDSRMSPEQSAALAVYPEPESVPESPRPPLFGVNVKLDITVKSVSVVVVLGVPVAVTV